MIWFLKVKEVAGKLGFAVDNAAYKADPEAFKGNVSDAAEILRIAVTGGPNSPDLCTIMGILGKDRAVRRLLDGRLNA